MHKAIRYTALLLVGRASIAGGAKQQRNLPQDKGPSKIDVSAYPPEMQKATRCLTDKCSKCHTIARPINTTMTKPEWERYVKRMMHKPNSGISDSQGKTIFEFLAYDQKTRKDKNPSAFSKSLVRRRDRKAEGATALESCSGYGYECPAAPASSTGCSPGHFSAHRIRIGEST